MTVKRRDDRVAVASPAVDHSFVRSFVCSSFVGFVAASFCSFGGSFVVRSLLSVCLIASLAVPLPLSLPPSLPPVSSVVCCLLLMVMVKCLW